MNPNTPVCWHRTQKSLVLSHGWMWWRVETCSPSQSRWLHSSQKTHLRTPKEDKFPCDTCSFVRDSQFWQQVSRKSARAKSSVCENQPLTKGTPLLSLFLEQYKRRGFVKAKLLSNPCVWGREKHNAILQSGCCSVLLSLLTLWVRHQEN